MIGFSSNPNATVQPTLPYYLIAYPTSGQPSVFDAGTSETFSWQVAYPSGTQLLMSFVDAKGNSGGVGPLYTVVSGTVSCPYYAQSSSNGFNFS